MTEYAELEIGVHRRDADNYVLELSLNRPDSEAENRVSSTMQLDIEALRSLELDDTAYGRQLMTSLCADPEVKEIFAVAQSFDGALRVRLTIGPSAPELHSLRWETLRDLDGESPLSTNENILFSRYLNSLDWRPIRLRPQDELRALVAIANPSNLNKYGLAEVDVKTELERAKVGLGEIAITELAEQGQVTLANIIQQLREEVDILYLVCHGKLSQGQPHLFLEKSETGETDVVRGAELVTRLNEMQQRPRLVVLASCQSAGTGDEARTDDEGALAGLGPRLAEAGIPAVLAMQGNVMMGTVAQFMPTFFKELQQDGQIDRAMTVARGVVRDQFDWWVPVLFMRLKAGRLWYTPGFTGDSEGTEKWPALIDSIFEEECTPILGPGLTEPLFGTRQTLAHQLAADYNFPLVAYAREDLPQVGQYITTIQTKSSLLPREFIGRLFQEGAQLHTGILPDKLQALANKKKVKEKELIPALNDLTRVIGEHRRTQSEAEPYHVLARLPFPIYITTDPTNLLVDALEAVEKKPRLELCRWHSQRFKDIPSIYEKEPKFWPDEDNPLVYQLFGHINWPESLVLTEDDYFDYLIGITSNTDLIPNVVREALVNTALLFLGFQMDDWNFRVFFRSIMSREGRDLLDEHPHIAAQITPEEGRILEPERARQYLETYFQKNAAISIYWGSAEDFISQLHQRWDWDE